MSNIPHVYVVINLNEYPEDCIDRVYFDERGAYAYILGDEYRDELKISQLAKLAADMDYDVSVRRLY